MRHRLKNRIAAQISNGLVSGWSEIRGYAHGRRSGCGRTFCQWGDAGDGPQFTCTGFVGIPCDAPPPPPLPTIGPSSRNSIPERESSPSPEVLKCRQEAEERVAKEFGEVVRETRFVPLKRAGIVALNGAIIGCKVASEAGCIEGLVPGAIVGALGGLLVVAAEQT